MRTPPARRPPRRSQQPEVAQGLLDGGPPVGRAGDDARARPPVVRRAQGEPVQLLDVRDPARPRREAVMDAHVRLDVDVRGPARARSRCRGREARRWRLRRGCRVWFQVGSNVPRFTGRYRLGARERSPEILRSWLLVQRRGQGFGVTLNQRVRGSSPRRPTNHAGVSPRVSPMPSRRQFGRGRLEAPAIRTLAGRAGG